MTISRNVAIRFQHFLLNFNVQRPVADPGFPRGGANLFGIIFTESCMKMKKWTERGPCILRTP